MNNGQPSSQSVPSASEPTTHATAGRLLCRPELLAPAGDWQCAKAAVENGADAIYFGLERFNARMRAQNFTEADLPKLMEFLHQRGVKGYVTFNTLVFANELQEAEKYLRAIISAGVDAAIVQDVGICRLIRRLSPDFPIHASTQMTVTSAAGVRFAKELGCNLVVLARECSVKEIEKIQAELVEPQAAAGGKTAGSLEINRVVTTAPALPLEVFVHGALCVAYSGQCLTSESLGGRSANRGECAQACRMPYELLCDGQIVALGEKRYLLSPQDLAGLQVLPDLVCAGVSSLKIEGRLKSPEYVANITRVYRQAIDRVMRSLQDAASSAGDERLAEQLWAESRYRLEMGFSRGLYTGWFRGINNQELAHARFGKKRGVFLGEVLRIQRERVLVELQAPLQRGDGLVFDAGQPDQTEQGGRVYSVESSGEQTWLGFGKGDIDFEKVRPGQKLWKTSDPQLDRALRQTFAGTEPKFQRPLDFEVSGRVGEPLGILARDEFGNEVRLASIAMLSAARTRPLTANQLREQLGRLGGTPFRIGHLKVSLEGDVMLPVSELNRLRRDLVKRFEMLRRRAGQWKLDELSESVLELPQSFALKESIAEAKESESVELVVLARTLSQLESALDCGIQTVYCDFENPKRYREAVEMARSKPARQSGPTIWVAPPRIFKTGEEWILKQVRSCDADGYLIRNYDQLKFFAGDRCIGDFSLNIANPLSAEYFLRTFGLERVTASYDLNFTQLEALLKTAPPKWFEVTIHQHMPMFHMEHCVFCAFLSSGTDYTNCGRPCDKHEVKLRDRVGAEHPVRADIGCRNTVFNALAQTGAEFVGRIISLGVRKLRVEFLGESPAQVVATLSMYKKLLRREITGEQLWRELKLRNELGVTRGQFERADR